MLSERMKKLTPYIPGEQPQDRTYIKLNTNENPYPPSPKIKAFLESFDIERLRLYSDPLSASLRESIAEKEGVQRAQVFVSNGSDEALSFCFYAFFDSKVGKLLFPALTYSFYPVYCDFYGIEYQKIPLDHDYGVDIDGFLDQKSSCGVIFANPNAPTGISLPLDRIKMLLENYPEDKIVIIDEAYVDFGGMSAVGLVDDYKNLLIVKTFSKSMSLAGLRLGFVIGNMDLIGALFTVKDSFNSYPADILSQLIGEIALSDEAYYHAITKKIIETRAYFCAGLKKLGWHVLPSSANFVFTRKSGVPGQEIYLNCKERGILVRYFDLEGVKDFVRITIGTRSDMEKFLAMAQKLF